MVDWSVHNSSSKSMEEVDDGSVDLIATSPPYNVGKDYDEYDDALSLEEYKKLLSDVFAECYRVLDDGGRIAVNVAQVVDRPLIDLPNIVIDLLQEAGFKQREHRIWYKGSSESTSAWGSWRSASNPYEIFNHEHILVFNKGDWKREGVGKITKDVFLRDIKSVWEIKPSSRQDHPAVFPVELPRRLIRLHSFKYNTVLDPFAGSGSTGVAAVQMDRDFMGYDISKEYCETARKRIASVDSQATDW